MRTNYLNLRKLFFAGLLCMIVAGISFTGCSKDDEDGEGGGDIGVAVGTYKGTMTVHTDAIPDPEYFDAIVTVSKDGDDRLKVTPKSGEDYSVATPKSFPVFFQPTAAGNIDVVVVKPGAVEGAFQYITDGKTLEVITVQQSESEITFGFEGTKQ